MKKGFRKVEECMCVLIYDSLTQEPKWLSRKGKWSKTQSFFKLCNDRLSNILCAPLGILVRVNGVYRFLARAAMVCQRQRSRRVSRIQ